MVSWKPKNTEKIVYNLLQQNDMNESLSLTDRKPSQSCGCFPRQGCWPFCFPISPRAPVDEQRWEGRRSEQPAIRMGRPSGGKGFRMFFVRTPDRCAFTRSRYRAGRLWIPRFPSRGDCFLSTPFLLSHYSLISAPGSTLKVSTHLESQK